MKAFKVFVYLERKILDFDHQLEDEFVSVEDSDVGHDLIFNFSIFIYFLLF